MDSNSAALSNARVVLTTSDGYRHESLSDSTGKFQVAGASPGEARLVVTAEGYEPEIATIVIQTTATEHTAVLQPAVFIHGRVVSESMTAIPGAVVQTECDTTSNRAITDETGAFSVNGCSGRTVHFIVAKSGYSTTEKLVGKVESITFVMKAAGSVVGRVRVDERFRGLPVVVTVFGEAATAIASASADGSFRVEDAPAGSVMICAEIHRSDGISKTIPRPVVVAVGQETWVDLALDDAVQIHGFLKASEDLRVSHASVLFRTVPDNALVAVASADSAGYYSALVPIGVYSVDVVGSGGAVLSTLRVDVGNDRELDIVVSK